MSKNQSTTPTMILCQTSDISAAVDALRAEFGDAAPSKSKMLNIIAATLCGPRRNWGFIKTSDQAVVSQRLEPNLQDEIAYLLHARLELSPDEDPFEEAVYAESRDMFVAEFENDERVQQAKSKGIITDEMLHDFCVNTAAMDFTMEYGSDPLFKDKALERDPYSYIQDAVTRDVERYIEKFLADPTGSAKG